MEEANIDTKGVDLGMHVALTSIDAAVELWSKLGWSLHTIQPAGPARSGRGQSFYITFEIDDPGA